jgi:hypothetical protein
MGSGILQRKSGGGRWTKPSLAEKRPDFVFRFFHYTTRVTSAQSSLTMFCLGLPYIMHMVMSVMPIPQSDGIPEARKRWDGIARS